jgi:Cu-Zn family superoxide dismutase
MKRSSILATVPIGLLSIALFVATVMAQSGSMGTQSSKGSMGMKPDPTRITRAVCVLQPVGESKVTGVVTFSQTDKGIQIVASLEGLEPGDHGFHIHQYGDCSSPGAKSAGGHFNPGAAPHGAPDAATRHIGDLGNIAADASGKAEYSRLDAHLAFHGPHSIIGRGIIVHAQHDDLTSQPTGAAGARVACGVIGAAAP